MERIREASDGRGRTTGKGRGLEGRSKQRRGKKAETGGVKRDGAGRGEAPGHQDTGHGVRPRKAFQEKVREVHEVGLLRGILLRDCTREEDKQVGCAP